VVRRWMQLGDELRRERQLWIEKVCKMLEVIKRGPIQAAVKRRRDDAAMERLRRVLLLVRENQASAPVNELTRGDTEAPSPSVSNAFPDGPSVGRATQEPPVPQEENARESVDEFRARRKRAKARQLAGGHPQWWSSDADRR